MQGVTSHADNGSGMFPPATQRQVSIDAECPAQHADPLYELTATDLIDRRRGLVGASAVDGVLCSLTILPSSLKGQ